MSRENRHLGNPIIRVVKKLRLGQGMYNDLVRKLPYYPSDWKDSINYRVIPATLYIYFANILPALAFSFDMYQKTHRCYGVNEVLLSSALNAVVFAIFAGQPLCIVGVTGPVAIFSQVVYEIMTPRGTPFLNFMCLICLWSMGMHIIIALCNGVVFLKLITRFSCDVFGFYVAFIYLQKGIQVIGAQFEGGQENEIGLICVSVAMCFLVFGLLAHIVGTSSPLFNLKIRTFISDYGTVAMVVFFTGFIHIGKLDAIKFLKLPTTRAFYPTLNDVDGEIYGRTNTWFIHFWNIRIADVFIAIPFAFLLTILFYFDHNVSSLICQGTAFPLKKPGAFHWDFFVLGITTGVAGILGIPPGNGLIPQAPFHTNALTVIERVPLYDTESETNNDGEIKPSWSNEINSCRHRTSHDKQAKQQQEIEPKDYKIIATRVVEQRASNLLQGLMTIGTMTGPLLIVLHLVPQAVLAGLFWVMGLQAIHSNGITKNLWFIFKDHHLVDKDKEPLASVNKKSLYLFVIFQLVSFGATFAISQTIAAIGFPGILMLFSIFALYFPRIFPKNDLKILDGPAASDMIMDTIYLDR